MFAWILSQSVTHFSKVVGQSHFSFAIAVALCAMLLGKAATAAPPPIPEDELIELCDLVISAEIVSVALPSERVAYLAKAKVTETHKGKAPVDALVPVYFFLPTGAPGDPGVAIYTGQKLKLFLLELEPGKYEPFDHNEALILEDVDEAEQVMPKPGQVIYAKDYQPAATQVPTYSRPRRFFRRFRR